MRSVSIVEINQSIYLPTSQSNTDIVVLISNNEKLGGQAVRREKALCVDTAGPLTKHIQLSVF